MKDLTFVARARILACACTAAAALVSSTQAHAESGNEVQPDAAAATPGPRAGTSDQSLGFQQILPDRGSVEISAAIGHVTVGRAGDGLGRTVYAARHAFSGSDRLVAFSTRRPAPSRSSGGHAPAATSAFSAVALPSQLPLNAAALTSGFGHRRHPLLGGMRVHSGIDLAAPVGTPVFATSDGTVNTAGWGGGYGLLVALDHAGAMQTRYGHLSQIAVAPGQQVRKGEIVGFVGSTGMSTGPHLHYEVRVNGRAVNPMGRRR